MDDASYLDIHEASEFLNVSRSFLYKNLHKVPHFKVGGLHGKLLFSRVELAEWIEQRRVPIEQAAGATP